MARLKEIYNNEIKKNLKSKFNYKNDLAIPKLEKVVPLSFWFNHPHIPPQLACQFLLFLNLQKGYQSLHICTASK